jgi:pSer/pThr/pTyr-binding forkhead associated (FHA) protein
MLLGLACHVCGQLNALSAQACTRCGTVLAPAPVAGPPVAYSPAAAAPRPAAPAPRPAASSPSAMGHPPAPSPGGYAPAGATGAYVPSKPTASGYVPGSPSTAVVAATAPTAGGYVPAPATTAARGYPSGPGGPSLVRPVPGAPPGGGTPPAGLEDLETLPQQRFDPATGQPLTGAADQPPPPAAKTMFFGALQQQPVVPRLVVIKGEGGDGATYHLRGTNTTIGRSSAEITFSEDPFLSPEHAKFTSQNGRLFVQDVGSANGVFLRIKKPTPLDDGAYLLVGEQLLRLAHRPFGDGSPNADGTYFYGSPRPVGEFQVVQCLAGGGEGRTVTAEGSSLSLGREANTMNFPDDRFISGHHARLDASSDGDHVILTDTGSRNGTFIRLTGAQELFHGDYLFVGQQLLRVEIA